MRPNRLSMIGYYTRSFLLANLIQDPISLCQTKRWWVPKVKVMGHNCFDHLNLLHEVEEKKTKAELSTEKEKRKTERKKEGGKLQQRYLRENRSYSKWGGASNRAERSPSREQKRLPRWEEKLPSKNLNRENEGGKYTLAEPFWLSSMFWMTHLRVQAQDKILKNIYHSNKCWSYHE